MVSDLTNNIVMTGHFVLECSEWCGKTPLQDTISFHIWHKGRYQQTESGKIPWQRCPDYFL